jgi:hypothetical protein
MVQNNNDTVYNIVGTNRLVQRNALHASDNDVHNSLACFSGNDLLISVLLNK